ncbi:putative Methyltransferase FkbM domain protein [uncultured Woeseiaceae bacterium]|uniref:Putative Methyltransferase FkbM domain protein n=1 Tax=uncultured Woeseiaceae bacterium TaxID=1983305 RepID=A0A7D9D0Y8_9GAMM|nr:putative Methyltransferase FkbM domain protein [uncultured Woeseiaceae bacterium]
MSVKQRVLSVVSRLLGRTIRIVGGSKSAQIAAHLAEDLSPTVSQNTEFGTIKFFCPGKLPEWRARTLLTKEPETLEWIGTFGETDVLWDIGANVGVYSLYAATKGHSVLAFEPSPSNYYLLGKNVEINKLDGRVLGYCVALNDTTKLDTFFMSNTELGGALSSFGEAIDWQGRSFVAQCRQSMVGFSVDDFIKLFAPPFPNHIKIDVDGIEDRIIIGARQTLADKRLKSVLVELDSERTEYCQGVAEALATSGLILLKKEHAPEFDQGESSAAFNYIFVRPDSGSP